MGVSVNNCLASSDHSMVSVVRPCQGKFQRLQKSKQRSFTDFKYEVYDWELRNTDISDIFEEPDPEQQVLRLTAFMNVIADRSCPVKESFQSEFHTRWLTPEIRDKIKLRDELYKKYKGQIHVGIGDRADQYFSEYKKVRKDEK